MMHRVKWRYLINAAGQSYPLRTPEEMVDILRIYNGANDIEGIYKRRIFIRFQKVTTQIHSSTIMRLHLIMHQTIGLMGYIGPG